jgi:biopolymer transport protein ExbD
MSAGGLRAALERRFQKRPLDRVVYLRADRELEYQKVEGALSLASGAGARFVGLITREQPATTPRAAP